MNDNFNAHNTNNIHLLDPKEQHSFSKSISMKKRFFSSISHHDSSNHFNSNIIGKKYKPSHTSNNDNLTITIKEKPRVSHFKLEGQKEKKKILSSEEIILEECKKHKFKALPLNKSLFSHTNKRKEIKSATQRLKPKAQKVNTRSFTPNPLPSFTSMAIKKSQRQLTIAIRPKLHTKERSLKRQAKEENKKVKTNKN